MPVAGMSAFEINVELFNINRSCISMENKLYSLNQMVYKSILETNFYFTTVLSNRYCSGDTGFSVKGTVNSLMPNLPP